MEAIEEGFSRGLRYVTISEPVWLRGGVPVFVWNLKWCHAIRRGQRKWFQSLAHSYTPHQENLKGFFKLLVQSLESKLLLSKNILWIIFWLSSVARIYSVWVRSDVEKVERVQILSGVVHSQIRCSGVSPFSVLFKFLKYCIATTVWQEVNSWEAHNSSTKAVAVRW